MSLSSFFSSNSSSNSDILRTVISMAEEGNDEVPEYEAPSVAKALEFFETTLAHRIVDPGQVGLV